MAGVSDADLDAIFDESDDYGEQEDDDGYQNQKRKRNSDSSSDSSPSSQEAEPLQAEASLGDSIKNILKKKRKPRKKKRKPTKQPITEGTFSKRKKRTANWTETETKRFFSGIRQFGPDFSLLSLLFPGKTREQVKMKFKAEEKSKPTKMYNAVKTREEPDMVTFNKWKARTEEYNQKEQEKELEKKRAWDALIVRQEVSTADEPQGTLLTADQLQQALGDGVTAPIKPPSTEDGTAVEPKVEEEGATDDEEEYDENEYAQTSTHPVTSTHDTTDWNNAYDDGDDDDDDEGGGW